MKLTLSKKIEHVREFVIARNELFYIPANEVKLVGIPETITLKGAERSHSLTLIGDQYLQWTDGDERTLIYDLKEQKPLLEVGPGDTSYRARSYLIDGKIPIGASPDPTVYLLEPESGTHHQTRLKNLRYFFLTDDGEKVFLCRHFLGPDRNLYRYDLEGNQLWCFKIEGEYTDFALFKKPRRLSKILGLDDKLLWLLVAETELIAINVDSGEEVHNIKTADQLKMDSQRRELVGLHFEKFFRVDLKTDTPTFESHDIAPTMSAHQITADFGDQLLHFNQQYLYFVDGDHGKVGVFDRETLEVTYTYSVEIPQGGIRLIRDFKVSHDNWYVLDKDETLHILNVERD